jgi:hypothetical protein
MQLLFASYLSRHRRDRHFSGSTRFKTRTVTVGYEVLTAVVTKILPSEIHRRVTDVSDDYIASIFRVGCLHIQHYRIELYSENIRLESRSGHRLS